MRVLTNISHSRRDVTILFHDGCSLVEVPDCSFTAGFLFMSRKGHLQSGVVRKQGVTA